ncbi:MAG TPA: T9SS type A sorting domain-containing protein [Bacteroidia bacterium]|nr:T9SS type A sorting domain-containing protein [Bacteroidia bacterium]
MKKNTPACFIIVFCFSVLVSVNLSAQHAVSTLCGTSAQGNPLSGPNGMCITPDGTTLYVVDYTAHSIKKVIIASGTATNYAGSGTSGYADGAASTSQFSYPSGIKISSDGTTLYISDNGNCLIRKIDLSNNMVTTIAGVYNAFAFADSSDGLQAKFNQPIDIAIAPGDSVLYVSDSENHLVRKVNLVTTAVTTVAGTPGSFGSANGIGSAAKFRNPNGLSLSADGLTLFVADAGNHKIRKINLANNLVSTLAGTGASGSSDNAVGSLATFNSPQGVAVLPDASVVYVTDTYNSIIRQIDVATTSVTTIAGGGSTPTVHFADNPVGLSAKFWYPANAVLSAGMDKLYISDQQNFRVRTMLTDIPTSTEGAIHQAISPVTVYPNPVNDFLTLEIQAREKTEMNYRIISVDGKRVFDNGPMIIQAGSNTNKINCGKLKPGTYVLQYFIKNKSYHFQFQKI